SIACSRRRGAILGKICLQCRSLNPDQEAVSPQACEKPRPAQPAFRTQTNRFDKANPEACMAEFALNLAAREVVQGEPGDPFMRGHFVITEVFASPPFPQAIANQPATPATSSEMEPEIVHVHKKAPAGFQDAEDMGQNLPTILAARNHPERA